VVGSFTFERQQALLVVLARVFAQVNYFGGREPLNGELEDVVEQRVDRQRAFSDPPNYVRNVGASVHFNLYK